MTKDQAKVALNNGKKIAHLYFSKDEWVKKANGEYQFEDGVICEIDEFWEYRSELMWDNGWEIYSEKA